MMNSITKALVGAAAIAAGLLLVKAQRQDPMVTVERTESAVEPVQQTVDLDRLRAVGF